MSAEGNVGLSRKTVLFVDNGLFFGFARRVAPAFGKAYYYSPFQSQFVTSRRLRVGDGFDEIERIVRPQAVEDEIDLFVFLDLFHADWQFRLRQQGRRVWGAGYSEELELERWEFRKWLQKNGLPVVPAQLITGIPALTKHLDGTQNKWIKLAHGLTRGDMETWKWKSAEINSPRLRQLAYDLGPFGEDTQFIVEEDLPDCVEIGYDGYSIDGKFPTPSMQAYEIKGLGMVGVVKPYDELASAIRIVNDVLAPTLAAYPHRGFLCTELRCAEDGAINFTDPCQRCGSPSNELLQVLLKDWPAIFWDGANGVLRDPQQVAKFGALAMVYAADSGKDFQPLSYPKEIDQWVIPRNAFRGADGVIYSIPQGEPTNIAGVVGIGDTIIEAMVHLSENVKQVDGHLLEIGTDAMEKACEVIEEGEAAGVKFDGAAPSVEEVHEALAD